MLHVALFKIIAKPFKNRAIAGSLKQYVFSWLVFLLAVLGILLSCQIFAYVPFAFFKTQIPQDFTLHLPFNAGTESSYFFSDANSLEFNGGVVRLKAAEQTDNSVNTGVGSGGFLNGALNGVQWDGVGGVVRLNSLTNTSDLDSSWTPAWNNLIGYWKLNGSGSISTNDSLTATVGTHGVANSAGAFSYSAGKINEGISFSAGLNRYSVAASLPISGAYTISFWIKLTSFPTTISAPVSATSSGSKVWQIHFNNTYTGDGPATYAIYAISGSGIAASAAETFTNLDLGNWRHIVMTYDSAVSPKTQFYKDGFKLNMSLNNITGNFPTHDTLWVGGRRGDNNTCCDSNGSFDDFAIWNKALTENEVQSIFDRQSAKYSGQITSRVIDAGSTGQSWTTLAFTTKLPFFKELPGVSGSENSSAYSAIGGNLMNGLTNYWRFNESSGSTLNDSVGTSSGTWEGSGSRWVAGVFGRGGFFNGTDSRIMTTDTDVFSQNKFSIAFWIKVDAFDPSPANISCAVCRPTHYFGTSGNYQGSTNTFSAAIGSASNGNSVGTSTTSNYPTGVWHHYVAVYDGTQTGSANRLKLYINGVQQTLVFDAIVPATPYDATGALRFGASSFSSTSFPPFKGSLDDVAIWSGTALAATDILELYRRGANRIKYQVRTCSSANCSDQEALTSSGKGWKGPDNSSATYFSELYNTSTNTPNGSVLTGAPIMTFSNFSGSGLSVASNRYVQYRAIFESEDGNSLCTYGSCSPELQAVSLGPNHYSSSTPFVTSGASVGSTYRFLDIAGFIPTLGANGCSAGVKYALSSDGTDFYYWNGSAWALSTGETTANDALTLSLNQGSFHTSPAGYGGVLRVRAYLKSDGASQCEVDNIQVNGKK